MSSDIVFQNDHLNIQATNSVRLETPAIDHAQQGVQKTLLRMVGDEIALNPDREFSDGVVVAGSVRVRVPPNHPLPDALTLGPQHLAEPNPSEESEVDLIEEIRRLRTQLWYTQKMLLQVVVPALLKEAPGQGS